MWAKAEWGYSEGSGPDMSKETGWNLSKPCGNLWKPDSHLVAWKPGTHLLALAKKPELRMSAAPRRWPEMGQRDCSAPAGARIIGQQRAYCDRSAERRK